MKRALQIAMAVLGFFVVACSVDAGMSEATTAAKATATTRPTTEIELHIGERFTVTCVDTESVITYGDNGGEDFPATGIAGFCE